MKLQTIGVLLCVFFLSSCASSYHLINPPSINYLSNSNDKSVILDYKYSLLPKKYAKKETKNNIKLIAVKLTNNSDRDLIFGKDIKLVYGNGSDVILIENERVYTALKQQSTYYLFYMLLTPAKFSSSSNGQQTSSFPIGYAIGPGLTAINMIVAGTANSAFKKELVNYNIIGTVVKKGATVYGLVGINSTNFENIKVKIE